MIGKLFQRNQAPQTTPGDAPDDPLARMIENDFVPYQCTSTPPPGRVLIVAPHSDDEALGCTAMIRHCVQNDISVQVLLLTDGARAATHADADAAAAYVKLRQDESRAAAQVLGMPEPTFLDLPDRGLSGLAALPDILAQEIARHEAQVIMAPSLHEVHPDHRAAAFAAVMACRKGSAQHLMFYEIGAPLWPNLLLDLTPHLDIKHKALQCYPSQMAVQAYDSHVLGLNQFRAYTLPPTVLAAEAYTVVHRDAWGDWPSLYGRTPMGEHLHFAVPAIKDQI